MGFSVSSSGLPATTTCEDNCRSTGRKELLWKEFFRDPSRWWDNRSCKPSLRYPDFKHKVTRDPLWVDAKSTPSWVIEELRRQGLAGGPDIPAPSSSPQSEIEALVASIRDCTKKKDLHRGACIHDDLLRRGLLHKCSDALVKMYAKCGELGKAKALLGIYTCSDPITWTALIAGYAREGQGHNALDCFERMQLEGILPDAVTYACLLKACATIGAIDKGKEIHEVISRQGLLRNDLVLGSALVDMYAKAGDLSMAEHVLEELPARNAFTWGALITGYAGIGQADKALACFEHMQRDDIRPDAVTYTCALKACAAIGAIEKGKQIHEEIVTQGLLRYDAMLGGALVDMYAKCGALSVASRVLKGLPSRNVACWSALIAGYVQEGEAQQALNCFHQMKDEGVSPNAVTYGCVLKAYATIGDAEQAKQIHDEIKRKGLLRNDTILGNTLVDMYVKCGDLSMARRVFEGLPSRCVVSWSTLIGGYAHEGQAEQALNCLEKMKREGILPDAVTLTCVLNVCSHRGLVEEGLELFMNMTLKYGVKPDLECYTCIVDLLGRAGHLEKAAGLLEGIPSADHSAVWHALLGACRKWGDVNVGKWAFERAVQVDTIDGPAYVLMESIYAAAGMEDKVRDIQARRIRNEVPKGAMVQVMG